MSTTNEGITPKKEGITPKDVPEKAEMPDQKPDLSKSDIAELGKSVVLEGRQPLTEVTDKTREVLHNEGYSDKIIDHIGSQEEANIYQKVPLEYKQVNGNDCLIRNDIDPNQKDDFGKTNLERMKEGKAPYDANERPYELHHIGQKSDSPLAELTRDEHRRNGNDTILHDKKKESEIDRDGSWNKQRADHWKTRAKDFE